MTRAAVAVVGSVLVFWGCSSPGGPDASTGDAGRCEATCGARQCGVDACGRSCGTCDAGTCDAATGRCREACTREPASAFCERAAQQGKTCGDITDVDACTGQPRTETCGACAPGFTCSAGHTCQSACTPEAASVFCARMVQLGKTCGAVTDVEPCTGQPRTESCGGCDGGAFCGASNTCQSTCTPESVASFCARLGKSCGAVTALDNCSVQRQYFCGGCDAGSCIDNACCAYEDSAAFCARMATSGKTCGVVDGMSCGTARQEDCGTARCTSGQACNYATNACATCTPETPQDFCARAANLGLECGQVTGTDTCTQLPRVVDCGAGACGGSIACVNNRCSGAAGTCAMPLALQVDALNPNRFTAQGNTANGTAALSGSCAGTSGAELVYTLTIPGTTARSLAATIKASAGSALSPTLYLRSTCASNAGETCRAGASMASVRLNSVTSGPLFLVVDSAAGAQGPFTLEVTLGTPLTAPANDTCSAPVSMGAVGGTGWVLDGTANTYSVTGTTVGANGELEGACGASGTGRHSGGDVVYALTVPASTTLSGTIRATSGAPDFLPAVYLRRTCGDASASSEVACGSASQPGTGSLTVSQLPAGTYAIVVDGVSGTAGPFTLQVNLDSP